MVPGGENSGVLHATTHTHLTWLKKHVPSVTRSAARRTPGTSSDARSLHVFGEALIASAATAGAGVVGLAALRHAIQIQYTQSSSMLDGGFIIFTDFSFRMTWD